MCCSLTDMPTQTLLAVLLLKEQDLQEWLCCNQVLSTDPPVVGEEGKYVTLLKSADNKPENRLTASAASRPVVTGETSGVC